MKTKTAVGSIRRFLFLSMFSMCAVTACASAEPTDTTDEDVVQGTEVVCDARRYEYDVGGNDTARVRQFSVLIRPQAALVLFFSLAGGRAQFKVDASNSLGAHRAMRTSLLVRRDGNTQYATILNASQDAKRYTIRIARESDASAGFSVASCQPLAQGTETSGVSDQKVCRTDGGCRYRDGERAIYGRCDAAGLNLGDGVAAGFCMPR
jgi:hypothetical protein